MLGKFGEPAMVLGGEQALFDGQFAHRDLERLEVADLLHHRCRRIVPMAVIVTVIV